jgi:hypothetical protein
MSFNRIVFLAAAATLLGGCAGGIDEDTGRLAGAAGGAAVGSTIGDGGIIAPAVGAVGGAIAGEELAEDED